jgi:PKD repeat protein
MSSEFAVSKPWSIRLLIGIIIVLMILPCTVSAASSKSRLTAQFSASPTSGQAPLTVQFTDLSTGTPVTYAWDFDNDGTTDSIIKSPSFTYQSVGSYTVKLTVTNAKGSDSEIKTDYISVTTQSSKPTAQFSASPTSGQAPLTVQFTDLSTGTPVTYAWDFNNDGTTDSIIESPSWTYGEGKKYTVTLTVTNANGSDSEIKTDYISVSTSSEECYGAETCNPTGDTIGGGAGYSRIITGTETGVKYVVSTKADLLTALESAESGEIVFVTGTAVIDLTGEFPVGIPAGVTLASNRGLSGSKGALIKKTAHTPGFIGSLDINGWYSSSWEEPMFYVMGDDVRVTGLQLEGEKYPQDYGNKKKQTYESEYLVGIFANNKSGFEVDNNEIRGWAWSGISMKDCPDAYIHHNFIHSNQARGEGYGSNLYGGNVLFEANLYDYNRHAITGAGLLGETYEARYNIVLGNGDAIGGHHFDVHQDEDGGLFAGDTYRIHHNTFMDGIGINGGKLASIGIRQRPNVGAYIDHNLFEAYSTETEDGKPIWERDSDENMFATSNIWMGEFYPINDGIVWFL